MMGLPPKAVIFLDDNVTQPQVTKTCGTFYGMFGNGYTLYERQLKSGQIAKEFVQAAPWSSGPCFFIGLRVYDTNGTCVQEFLWGEEEIDNC